MYVVYYFCIVKTLKALIFHCTKWSVNCTGIKQNDKTAAGFAVHLVQVLR